MKTRADFDANLNRLVGFTIDRVVYFEIDYQDGRPYFRDHPETGHFLDFGVEMIDPSGRSSCITWDATEDGRVVSMDTAIKLDPTLATIGDLPPGWWAYRRSVGEPWTRELNSDENGD